MHTVTIGGREYILRCDLNVIEAIEQKFGSIAGLNKKLGAIDTVKFLTAEMINEHFYYVGAEERVTPNYIGARMTVGEGRAVMVRAVAALSACVSVSTKNA